MLAGKGDCDYPATGLPTDDDATGIDIDSCRHVVEDCVDIFGGAVDAWGGEPFCAAIHRSIRFITLIVDSIRAPTTAALGERDQPAAFVEETCEAFVDPGLFQSGDVVAPTAGTVIEDDGGKRA